MNNIVLFNSFNNSMSLLFLFLNSYEELILLRNRVRKCLLNFNEYISVKKLRILSFSSSKNKKFNKSVFCTNK